MSRTSAYGTRYGADTHKMKYGHRGGNHPVKDLATGRVYISITEPWIRGRHR